jgi:hypothetical protein
MKNFLIGLGILIALAAGALVLLLRSDTPQPAEAVVFEMRYRGLSGEKGELRYNSWGGFGGTRGHTPFLRALKQEIPGLHDVLNPTFGGAQWSAVEVKGNEVVAFYFDRNADGKVSDDERILPVQSEETQSSRYWEFVTPDVVLDMEDGRQVPFRALLRVRLYTESGRLSKVWSPSSVLEGTATLAGKPTNLILYTVGRSDPFTYTAFGRS